jgi:tetratricopeptide (TPR) repeat protein
MQSWGRPPRPGKAGTPDAAARQRQECLEEKILKEKPFDGKVPYAAQGVAAYNAGRFQEAMELFSKSIEENPKSPVAWFYAGVLHLQAGYRASTGRIGEFDKAITCLSESMACGNSTPCAYTERAHAYILKGAMAEARADAKKALELDADYAKAYLVLTTCSHVEGRHREAIVTASKYCELAPEDKERVKELRDFSAFWYEALSVPKIVAIFTLAKLVPLRLPDGTWMSDFRQVIMPIVAAPE